MSQVVKTMSDMIALVQESNGVYEPIVSDFFVDGMYCRTVTLKPDTTLVGATHNNACINILAKGTIVIGDGVDSVKMTSPQVFMSGAGSQKAGYSVDEVVFINVFRSNSLNREDAEEELFKEKIYKDKKCRQSLQHL